MRSAGALHDFVRSGAVLPTSFWRHGTREFARRGYVAAPARFKITKARSYSATNDVVLVPES